MIGVRLPEGHSLIEFVPGVLNVESLREGMQSMATIVDEERAQAGGVAPLGTAAALREVQVDVVLVIPVRTRPENGREARAGAVLQRG